MALTSFLFLIFFAFSVALYYLIPRGQIALLLFGSAFFFVFTSGWKLYALFLLIGGITYFSAFHMNLHGEKIARLKCRLGILLLIFILGYFSYSNFFLTNINRFRGSGEQLQMLAVAGPIGISFYSLSAIGYILDCYWKKVEPETNYFKIVLFLGYWPQLTSGPITRYDEMSKQLFSRHKFQFRSLYAGLLRIVFGFFKKLVISSRCQVIVDTIYADPQTYSGLYIWFAALLFVLQLYTDFSGCMDIVSGASECYGIELPENFETPFFSSGIQEFWQRWHITLGAWLKDYILYPLLRSKAFARLSKAIRKHCGKSLARTLPSYLAMLIVWLLVGLWHGGAWKYVIGMGLWFWGWITLENILKLPSNAAASNAGSGGVKGENFSRKLLHFIKVVLVVAVGNMFFRLNSFTAAILVMRLSLSQFHPWIFFDGSILDAVSPVLSEKDFGVLQFGSFLLLTVSALHVKYGHARIWLSKQSAWFQYAAVMALLTFVLVFGMYGPGYEVSDFIYGGF